jgi:hypothetical protein
MKDEQTQGLDMLAYCDRMLDYAHLVHSLPESAADPKQQEPAYGAAWNATNCECGLYPYEHDGCAGPMAKQLSRDWQSGDDVPGYREEMWPPRRP